VQLAVTGRVVGRCKWSVAPFLSHFGVNGRMLPVAQFDTRILRTHMMDNVRKLRGTSHAVTKDTGGDLGQMPRYCHVCA
jgi:hypothetical protein